MKSVIRGMVVLSALAGALALTAQTPDTAAATPTADEVVSKHLAAIGGKDAINQVKSVTMDTSVQVMGNDLQSTTVILDGVGFKTETDFNGSKIVQCVNAKGGWNINPMTGASDPTPMSDDEYKAARPQIHVGGSLLDYAGQGSKVELVGKGTDGYKVKLTTKDNVEETYVFDPTTYYVKSMTRKGNMQGQEVEVTTTYSDYKKTDVGYMMPYQMDVDFGGQFQLSITVKKVELNKTIDPAIFEMPKAAAPAAAAPAKGM
jgi:hypothetical protein